MKILITGAKGFIGKNLIAELKNQNYQDILEFDIDTDISFLDTYTKECEFVFHLAGVNRTKEEQAFMDGNYGFTEMLLDKLKKHNNQSPILVSSSTQAELDNSYGKSKKAAEELLLIYQTETGNKVFLYRLPNVFGKWCRPNYNSAVATFCHNIANDLEITVNDPAVVMNLVYIDDVVKEFIHALKEGPSKTGEFCAIPVVHTETLGKIAELIESFGKTRASLAVPNMSNELEKKLYSTYLSYLPKESFSYPLKMNVDDRGSFTEFIRTSDRGQISVNISKPGIVKGNHWHHTKVEKFLVVSGKALIQFRNIDSDEVISCHVSGENLEVVDIPVGYTHNIINEGNADMVTIMWANEAFNPDRPDTYYMEVNR